MYSQIDATNDAISISGKYYTAMLDADGTKLKALFHPRAVIVGNFEGALEFSDLDAFLEGVSDAKTGDGPFNYHVDGTTVVGDTAVVTVSGNCYGTRFTDHLSMVKVDGKWLIVAKTFYAHP
jgi:hypothetical protein